MDCIKYNKGNNRRIKIPETRYMYEGFDLEGVYRNGYGFDEYRRNRFRGIQPGDRSRYDPLRQVPVRIPRRPETSETHLVEPGGKNGHGPKGRPRAETRRAVDPVSPVPRRRSDRHRPRAQAIFIRQRRKPPSGSGMARHPRDPQHKGRSFRTYRSEYSTAIVFVKHARNVHPLLHVTHHFPNFPHQVARKSGETACFGQSACVNNSPGSRIPV